MRSMELGIVINELNENVPVMDAYSYNVSFTVHDPFGDRRHSESGLGAGADTDQRLDSRAEKPGLGTKRRYDARFVRPVPPLFIEPVLTSPADYIHLGSLPKRAKLDEYFVRSTVPGVVYDTLLQRPHNVTVSDPLNALGKGENSTILMKSNLYGPDVRETGETAFAKSQTYHYATENDDSNQRLPGRSARELRLFTEAPPAAPSNRTQSLTLLPDSPDARVPSTAPPAPPLPSSADTPRVEPPELPADAPAVLVPATPVPSPPPLPSDAASTSAVDDGMKRDAVGRGDDWLSEIRQGVALRPVSDARKAVKASGGESEVSDGGGAEFSRDDLMNSIRQGVPLRPVRDTPRVDSGRDERKAMSRALMNRRAAIDPMGILRSGFKIMERAQADSDDEATDDGASFSENDDFDE